MTDLHVGAGALFDSAGRVLIAQRPAGKALAGRWEFPGGKLHLDEDPYAGLVRELREELGVARFAHLLDRVRQTLRASIDRRMEYAA